MADRTNTAKWDEKRGYWRIVVQRDGVIKNFYSRKRGRTGQREANRKADEWVTGGAMDTKINCDTLVRTFLEDEAKKSSLSRMKKLESVTRLYVLPAIGKKKVDALSLDDFQQIIDSMVDKGLAAKTVSNARSIMEQVLKYARRKKLTMLRLDDLDMSDNRRKKQKTILQPDGIVTLFMVDTCLYKGKRIYDDYINAYRFMVATGVRPGELLGLMWEDVHGETIHLQRAINVYGEVTSGKNQNAVRPVPVTHIVHKILDDQYQASGSQSGYVFPARSQSTLRHRWQNYCTSNNIPYCSLYELRHTFVSISSGIPEGQLKKIVGHSKSMDTFDVYGHLVDGQLAQTGAKIDGIFDRILGAK